MKDRRARRSSVAAAFSIEVTTAAVVVASSSIVSASWACSAISRSSRSRAATAVPTSASAMRPASAMPMTPNTSKAVPARRWSTPSSVIGGW